MLDPRIPKVSSLFWVFFLHEVMFSLFTFVRPDLCVTDVFQVRQLRVRENLLFPEASCGFERSLLEQVPLGVSSAHQSGSRTVSLCVCVSLSLSGPERGIYFKPSFILLDPTQTRARILFCFDPTLFAHKFGMWQARSCRHLSTSSAQIVDTGLLFLFGSWKPAQMFFLLWFGLIPGYFSILE